MIGTRPFATALLYKQPACRLLPALTGGNAASTFSHPAFAGTLHQFHLFDGKQFSTSRPAFLKEFFPQADSPSIRQTPPAWPHPIYTQEQMDAVVVAHRDARTFSDRLALTLVRILRWGLDRAMGYKHGPGFQMTERNYMIRNVFLESVAGVPGMVAGMLRHLRSMRTMRRDNGWIETLLEESYNERMHLLTFLKMAEPGWFMRAMVLGKCCSWSTWSSYEHLH